MEYVVILLMKEYFLQTLKLATKIMNEKKTDIVRYLFESRFYIQDQILIIQEDYRNDI